jgi:hypothetical protein
MCWLLTRFGVPVLTRDFTDSIPPSVVRLKVARVRLELVEGLLATRSTRDLQNVEFGLIEDAKAAALAVDLVSTDRSRQWEFTGRFTAAAAAAFCAVASAAHGTDAVCQQDRGH